MKKKTKHLGGRGLLVIILKPSEGWVGAAVLFKKKSWFFFMNSFSFLFPFFPGLALASKG